MCTETRPTRTRHGAEPDFGCAAARWFRQGQAEPSSLLRRPSAAAAALISAKQGAADAQLAPDRAANASAAAWNVDRQVLDAGLLDRLRVELHQFQYDARHGDLDRKT